MQQSGISQYCKLVSRQLICGKGTKAELISGLERSLAENPSFAPLSVEELQNAYAPVGEVAHMLQENVSEQECSQILRQRKRRKRILIGALVAALAIVSILFVVYISGDVNYFITA